MRRIIVKARQQRCRLVLPEGTQEATLRACRMLVDEGIASPVLLGREDEIRAAAQRLGHELEGVTIVDPLRSPRFDAYAQEYLRLRARRGVTPGPGARPARRSGLLRRPHGAPRAMRT